MQFSNTVQVNPRKLTFKKSNFFIIKFWKLKFFKLLYFEIFEQFEKFIKLKKLYLDHFTLGLVSQLSKWTLLNLNLFLSIDNIVHSIVDVPSKINSMVNPNTTFVVDEPEPESEIVVPRNLE